MRKINKVIIPAAVLTATTIAPLAVSTETYADIGLPYTYPYEVVVTNPDGAKSEKCNVDTIPKGAKLNVVYDYTNQDGETWMYVNDEVYGRCYVNRSDVDFADTTFDLSSVPEATPLSQYILTEESYLYKGPNERYGRNDDNYHLPAGIVVTSSYHDDVWMYVEYQGHTGWIYHYNIFQKSPKTANIPTDEWSRTIIPTHSTLELKDSPFEDGEVKNVISVEPLTEIPVSYYFNTSKFNGEVFIKTDQGSGWYSKNSMEHNVAFHTSEYNNKGITITDTSLMKDVDSEESFYTVPANTEYTASYYVGNGYMVEMFYIKANVGSTVIEGWANQEDLANALNGNEKDRTFDSEKQLYDKVNGDPIDVLEAGTYRIFNYHPVEDKENNSRYYWYYIGKQQSDGTYEKLGWIKDIDDGEIQEIEKKKEESVLITITNEEPEVYVYPIDEEPTQDTDGQIKNVLLWSLAGAGVLAIVIISSLLIVKKRKANDDTDGKNEPEAEKPTENEEADAEEKTDEPEVDNNAE